MSNAIALVVDSGAQPVRWPRVSPNFAGLYATEILGHAGLFFDTVDRAQIPSQIAAHRLAILPWDMSLSGPERTAIAEFVSSGGCLLGIGGTSGLDEVFGCSSGEPLAAGRLLPVGPSHPVTSHVQIPIPVFAGRGLRRHTGRTLAALAGSNSEPGERVDAVIENCFGRGLALVIGPDAVWSILHIQQGTPVEPEKVEGIVDVEKGAVLDLQHDRQRLDTDDLATLQGHMWDGSPDDPRLAFFEPMADNLRELLIRGVLHLCHQRGIVLPMLWYWPGDLRAIAHMSHDSDGNAPPGADRLFKIVNELGLQTTWCIQYPGGYEKDFYPRLREQGCEVALHFDAQTRKEHTCWSRDNLSFQHDWLQRETQLDKIGSNKNHYLRWEGRLEFFRWCQSVGIELDETKGPNYGAMNGFPFGGCHPWFPMDDEAPGGSAIDVLEVNLMTQDVVYRCPPSFGKAFADKALERGGVSHFLFHPGNIALPGVEPALREIVAYARSKGMQWWPAERINAWERARRGVTCRAVEGGFTFSSASHLPNACLLFLDPCEPVREPGLSVAGKPLRTELAERYGFRFRQWVVDLCAGQRDLAVSAGPPDRDGACKGLP